MADLGVNSVDLDRQARSHWSIVRGHDERSLSEVHSSIAVHRRGSWFRQLLAFSGPGYLVSVGYMDPGNWATDIAGGSRFGYALLSIIALSSLMAMLLQALSARLGVASGRDLAQACRDTYSRPVAIALWLACEIAIVACDLAEVIGTAIALKLLFGIPLIAGALIAALDVLLLLLLLRWGFRLIEATIVALLSVITICFVVEIALAAPVTSAVLGGFLPSAAVVRDPAMLYIAIGIIGATVMPHNLYLHSAIVQTRNYEQTDEGRLHAIRWSTIDSTLALALALFVNAAILVLAAAVFHATGRTDVQDIEQAHALLSPLLGVGLASVVFAVALLAAGMNSTVTATLAGQIVMEGFLKITIPKWARRLLTRAVAIVPVIVITALFGDHGTSRLLILSQVVLSMQLPFAVIPLVQFVSDRRKMGRFAISRPIAVLAWVVAATIVVLNVKLLWDVFSGSA